MADKKLFLRFHVLQSTSKKQLIEDLESGTAQFMDGHPVCDQIIPLPDSLDLKRTIIDNFIEYYTTDDNLRDEIKQALSDYIENDHCNELEFLDGQPAKA